MPPKGSTRASGEATASEVAKDLVEELDADIRVQLPDEDDKEKRSKFRTPGFSRMRVDWRGDDQFVLAQVMDVVEKRIMVNFADAYQLMFEVYDTVRTREHVPGTGEVVLDSYGLPVWKRTSTGSFEEDFTRLTFKQREHYLFAITTRLFDWEQRAADAWGEAMIAKAMWEESFSIGYDAPMSGTIEDRTAAGRKHAADERYFAILVSYYSRRADAIARSMALLGQRLKDSLGS